MFPAYSTMATVLLDQEIEIPTIEDLEAFRRWALSEEFPQRGRIDYIAGRVEVDMSPEDLFTHGNLKLHVAGRIEDRVLEQDLGYAFCGETRISSVAGNISSEPDVVVITRASIDDGSVRLIPKASAKKGRFVEIEGAADLVAEIVSDSSVVKDTRRLPKAYFEAGVREFWLIDARGNDLIFRIQRRGSGLFAAAPVDGEGYQRSEVLDAWYQLLRHEDRHGHWLYRLHMK
jgi:Uma2 family endonuclease